MKIELDPKSKTLTASAILRGESGPVEVRARYDVRRPRGWVLRIEGVECNREWMTILAGDSRWPGDRRSAGSGRMLELVEE